MRNMRRGFTLVELSVVLVIIGLLIGGILVAQSMIGTAKIQGQIRQFQQLDTAVNNFVTTYKYLPGDCPSCGTSSIVAGPGSSVIGNSMLENGGNAYGADPTQCQGAYSNTGRECLEFWQQMVRMNMAPYVNEFTDVTGYTGSANPSPHWAWAGNGSGYMWSVPQLSITPKGARENGIEPDWTRQGGLYWYSGWNNGSQAITSQQLLAIDAKIDDGVANTGNVMTADFFPPTVNDYIVPKAIGGDANCGAADGCCYSTSTSSHYNMSSGLICGMLVKANVY